MATEHGDLLQADLGDGEPTTHSEGRQLRGVLRARTIRPHRVPRAGSRRPRGAAAAPGEPLRPGVSARRGQLDFFSVSFFKIFFLNLFALKVIEKSFVHKNFCVF
jgi:hypothetical protein